MVCVLLLPLAYGQEPVVPDITVQLFRPSVDATQTLWVNDAARAPHRQLSTRFALSYMHDPLVFVWEDGSRAALAGETLELDVAGAYSFGPARMAAFVPVFLLAQSDVATTSAGLGDAVLDLKGTVVDPARNPAGIAFAGRLVVPSTTVPAPLGNRALGWEVEAIGEASAGPARLIGNLGHRALHESELDPELLWGDQLYLRGGCAVVLHERFTASAELAAAYTWRSQGNPLYLPIEGLLGGTVALSEAWSFRAAVGAGSWTIGAPPLRVVTMLAVQPPDRDPDGDAVASKLDRCPEKAEDADGFEDGDGCPDPDNDGDGFVDADDRCPDGAEDLDGYLDEDGCPDPFTATVRLIDDAGQPVPGVRVRIGDHSFGAAEFAVHLAPGTWTLTAEADGFVTFQGEVEVPPVPGEILRVMKRALHSGRMELRVTDDQGKPLDGTFEVDAGAVLELAGGLAATSLDVGDHRVVVRSAGMAPRSVSVTIRPGETAVVATSLHTPRVLVREEYLEINGKIFFETASAVIKEESFELLEEIAQTLADHDEVRLVRIEGHTDTRGDRYTNLVLSDARAGAVREYLVSAGVEAERMYSIGFGALKPLAPGDDEDAHAFNRRVEFWIEKRDRFEDTKEP